MALTEKLALLPTQPGVYIMKDRDDQIIYIGKAISLKNRVRSYFNQSGQKHPKVKAMVQHIADFEYIITDSELEALILECNLIKKHRPKYNILLKDDKHYPYLKVTLQEDFPRIIICREVKKDGAKYFGPYTNTSAVYETLRIIKKIFPLRQCKNVKLAKNHKPCLNYHIKQCSAPCGGHISKEEYSEIIKKVILFLEGRQEQVIKDLQEEMALSSENLQFEKAALLRDKIKAIEKVVEKQKMINVALADQDVIAFAKDDRTACVQTFFIRGGKLIGREHFLLDGTDDIEESEILTAFIKQFYMNQDFVPREILLQHEIDEVKIIESWLHSKRGQKVYIKVPKKGEKHQLLDLVAKNAEEALKELKFKVQATKENEERKFAGWEGLKERLHLDLLSRIEAYDVSNMQGAYTVASMVVFTEGESQKSHYRRFKIRTIAGQNDVAAIYEVISRRFKRGLQMQVDNEKRDESFTSFPDLILIDGGKGQVHSAQKALAELEIKIPVCGMIKNEKHQTRGLMVHDQEVNFPTHNETFKLITRIQDEAHRFAISYQQTLHKKGMISSILDEIPGIGPKRRQALLIHFKSITEIKEASIDKLKNVPEMNQKSAQQVYNYFRRGN